MRSSRTHTKIRLTALAAGIAVILAACGGAIVESSAPDVGSNSAAPTSMPEPTATPISTPTQPTGTPTTAAPAPIHPAPEDDGPTGDCKRSVRMVNIHYQLAFFAQCQIEPNSPPFPVYRKMDEVPTLQEKLAMLVTGPSAHEAADGLISGLDSVEERDQIEVLVNIDSAGTAAVDFLINGQRWNPGSRASASAQYSSFAEPLEATVFSDPTVTGLDRSTLCWGESDCTGITTRETWEGINFVNYGVLCDPAMLAWEDWGCFARDANTYAATVAGVASDDVLNMRSGPGVTYFTVGALAPDATVEVLENMRQATDGALWRLVRSETGEVGWVNSSFLTNTSAIGDRTAEEQLIDAFVEFAARPSDTTFAALPLAETVALGLGSEIISVVAKSTLRDAGTWELDLEHFRAAVGPFSAFPRLARMGDYQVIVGPHNHCASPPLPAPAGYEDLTRISIQPADGSIDSCLMWTTVDFFVSPDGEVAAITHDFWEP